MILTELSHTRTFSSADDAVESAAFLSLPKVCLRDRALFCFSLGRVGCVVASFGVSHSAFPQLGLR